MLTLLARANFFLLDLIAQSSQLTDRRSTVVCFVDRNSVRDSIPSNNATAPVCSNAISVQNSIENKETSDDEVLLCSTKP